MRDTAGRTTADEPVPVAGADELERVRRLLHDQLEAPYAGTIAWARTAACVELGHPRIRGDSSRPCYCGREQGE